MKHFLPLIVFIIGLCTAYPSQAELTIDVSEPNLQITTGFSGDTLTLFGTASPKGDIVILVKGPKNNTSIKRKGQIMGLWISSDSMTFKNTYGYYNIASSTPIGTITDKQTLIHNNLGLNNLNIQPVSSKHPLEKVNRFREYFIQNMQLKGLYSLTPDAVTYLNDTLFKTRIHMPPNVPLGQYHIDAFLFKDGVLIDKTTHPFTIKQIGLAADIHYFSRNYSLLYGLCVIAIALLSSFIAILLLRRD